MDKYKRLKEKFAKQQLIYGTTCSIVIDPLIVSKVDHPNMDYILFDCEHGRYDAQNLVPILHECRMMGLPTIVRIQDALYHLAAKPLDMGADGIMLPRTETLDQLKNVIDGLKFYPIGRKGCGGVAQFMPNEDIDTFNTSRFLLPQIESPKGIENLPAMLETYGEYISAIMIGPYDMSIMVGTPFDLDSDIMRESIQKIFDIARSFGKSCGIYCNTPEDAQKYRSMGANVLWTSSVTDFMQIGIAKVFEELGTIK